MDIQKQNKKVDFKVFSWIIAIIIIIFGWIFAAIADVNKKVDGFNANLTGIQVQLSQIQTDILWIKQNLSK